jgi:mono/diheme cytochrome c family protein
LKRRWRLAGVLLLALAAGGLLLVWRTVRHGLSVHDEAGRIEVMLAGKMRAWSTPSELRTMSNPVPLSAAVLAEARAHFADHCATCHGNDGKGQTQIGQRLYPRAPDMTLAATQDLGDGELFAIIENGIRLTGMPGWGDGTAESAYGSWTLVHLIRHLPQLTAQEVEEMRALNPVSPAELEAARAEAAFLEGADQPPQPDAEHSEHSH